MFGLSEFSVHEEIEMWSTAPTVLCKVGRLGRAAMIFGVSVGAAGCTAITEGMAARITDHALSHVEHQVMIIDGEAALFRHCLETRGGTCQGGTSTALPQTRQEADQVMPLRAALSAPTTAAVDQLGPNHPAQAGRAALSHSFLQKIVAVHNYLRGFDSPIQVPGFEAAAIGSADAPGASLTLSTSPEEVSDFVDQVNRATASGSWRALSEQAEKLTSGTGAGSADARQDARTLAFIHRYLDAYFENGKFVRMELDTRDLEARIESLFSRDFPLLCGDPSQAQQCDVLVASLQDAILKGAAKDSTDQDFVLLPLGTTGYVSRTGQPFAFPGLQIGLDPAGAQPVSAKIDMTAVGKDLPWVFLQALFDAHEGLPAVSTATGVDLGTAGAAFALPVFDPTAGNVSTEDFQDANGFSNQVSTVVGTAFDKAIRGIGPLSLNNEALEDLLVAIVTATVNDAAQKAAWCWFSCNLDQRIEQAAEDERKRIHSDLSRAAKRIALRLRLRR